MKSTKLKWFLRHYQLIFKLMIEHHFQSITLNHQYKWNDAFNNNAYGDTVCFIII